jgi:hypothetical protein
MQQIIFEKTLTNLSLQRIYGHTRFLSASICFLNSVNSCCFGLQTANSPPNLYALSDLSRGKTQAPRPKRQRLPPPTSSILDFGLFVQEGFPESKGA